MFSAYFLTCLISINGNQQCNVAYTEMPEWVTTQEECDHAVEQMHDFTIAQVETEFPELTLYRQGNGCYGGPLSGAEVARDEHAKLLQEGIDTSLSEIP